MNENATTPVRLHATYGRRHPEVGQDVAGRLREREEPERDVDRRGAEEDDADDESGDDNQDHRDPCAEDGDDELGHDEPAATDGPHQEVTQVAPGRFARDGVAPEERDHDHEQERAGDAQRERREDEPGLGREEQQASLAFLTRRVQLDRDGHDDRDQDDDPERDVRARAAEALHQLGADHRRRGHHRCASAASTRPRNASSSRRRAVTVSTAMPAWTNAATMSDRFPPSMADREAGLLGFDVPDHRQRFEHPARRGFVVDLEVHGTGVTDEVGHRPGGDEPALVHHHRAGADLFHLGEHVAREEHGRTRFRDPVHQPADLAHLLRVEPVGRLVEDQDLGPTQQHAGEAETLAHALRVGLDLAVDGGAEVGDGERGLDVGIRPLGAARFPPEAEVAHAREVGHECR